MYIRTHMRLNRCWLSSRCKAIGSRDFLKFPPSRRKERGFDLWWVAKSDFRKEIETSSASMEKRPWNALGESWTYPVFWRPLPTACSRIDPSHSTQPFLTRDTLDFPRMCRWACCRLGPGVWDTCDDFALNGIWSATLYVNSHHALHITSRMHTAYLDMWEYQVFRELIVALPKKCSDLMADGYATWIQ